MNLTRHRRQEQATTLGGHESGQSLDGTENIRT